MMALRYVTFINVKQTPSGTSIGRNRGRLTVGMSTKAANAARQKANINPRCASGQSSKIGARANKPHELHINAAATTQRRPINRSRR
jgi:hypothetical protein